MLHDVECNDQIESAVSPGIAHTRIRCQDVEPCLDRSGLQRLASFTAYPVCTSAACPAGEGTITIADLANPQTGRIVNARGLELALEVQRLFALDPAKVNGAPILPHGITVADRCVAAVARFKWEHGGVGYVRGIIHTRLGTAGDIGNKLVSDIGNS